MTPEFHAWIRCSVPLLLLLVSTAHAQVTPFLPDTAQIARMKAMAQAMKVAPAARTRDRQQVIREPSMTRVCSMTVGATPDGGARTRGLGATDTTIVVTGTPTLVCGI